MSSSRKCKLSADSFCYVCGLYTNLKQVKYKIKVEARFSYAYELYFGMKIGDQDKYWAPRVICGTCQSNLDGWLRGDRHSMPFAIPRIWREPQNHTDDCYVCMVDISRFRKTKNRRDIAYPSIPLPKPPGKKSPEDLAGSEDIEKDSDDKFNVSHTDMNSEPHFPSQQELDDLVRDMGLTKSNAELLTSRLKRWNLLDSSCRCSSSKKRRFLSS